MRGRKACLILLLVPANMLAERFSGPSAWEFTRQVVEYGPRPPGSPALARLRHHLVEQLRQWGWYVELDEFEATTPRGRMPMANVLAHRPGREQARIVLSGHYDTKWFENLRFVGANDGGASTGFLLEMARALRDSPLRKEIWLVWFDGEEALEEWSETDGIYGSRHLADRWEQQGVIPRIEAWINVDMIGDRDLGILEEYYSDPGLRSLIWRVARQLGYGKHFLNRPGAVVDDHVPFLRKGVRAVNLIDFDYGPANSWWHTEEDTLDKLSPASFQAIGDVLMEVLRRLGAFEQN